MAYSLALSTVEYLDATTVAVDRMRASTAAALNHANVRRRSLPVRLHNDILGAASELAVAKWLGIPWSRSVNTFTSEADVGEDIDVRATHRPGGSLILRQKDHPYRWFVLVTGEPPNMALQGYVHGTDAMLPEFWCNPRDYGGAWFVPQSALLPVPPDGQVPDCLRQREPSLH